jgi:hypothetical protein
MPRDVSEEIRDIVVATVRDKPIENQLERFLLAMLIEIYWGSNPKAEKRIARQNEAEEIKQALADLVEGGMSAEEAKNQLVRDYGRHSVTALEKWLLRNRVAKVLDREQVERLLQGFADQT